VHFVNNYVRDVGQGLISAHEGPQEHSVGAKRQQSFGRDTRFQTNLEANSLANLNYASLHHQERKDMLTFSFRSWATRSATATAASLRGCAQMILQ